MRHTPLVMTSLVLGALLSVRGAQAQATRTFVSGVGNDADPCNRTTPCRTFAGAIVKTFINGEINALDPGGFGTVNITKSITINGEGTLASILASGTTGIIVNIAAGNVNDPKRRVHLRNLTINGTGASGAVGTATGITGIRFTNGSQLIVEDCLIQGFSQFGIDYQGATNASLTVRNTTITDIALSAVRVTAASTNARVLLRDVLINKAGFGFDMTNNVATIDNSMITHVTNQAIAGAGSATINVNGGVVAHNGTGVSAGAGSTVRIANLAILNNNTGINAAGTVASFGGNKNAGNVVPGAPNANIPLQ